MAQRSRRAAVAILVLSLVALEAPICRLLPGPAAPGDCCRAGDDCCGEEEEAAGSRLAAAGPGGDAHDDCCSNSGGCWLPCCGQAPILPGEAAPRPLLVPGPHALASVPSRPRAGARSRIFHPPRLS